MATFEVDIGGKVYEIEAPDQSAAMNAAKTLAPSRKQQVQDEFNAKPWYSKAATAVDDIARIAIDDVSFGTMDKGAAKLNSMLGGKSYDEELAARRRATEDARTRAGWAGTAAGVAGGVASGGMLAKAGLTAARLVPSGASGMFGLGARTAASAADGAAMGAASAMGHDTDIGEGAMLGIAGGAAGNLIGAGLSKAGEAIGAAFRKKPVVPTIDEVRDAASKAYAAADASGVAYTPQMIQRVEQDAIKRATDMGYHPKNQPGVDVALGELKRLADQNVTLKGVDTARKLISGGYIPGNKQNNAMLTGIIDDLDTAVMNTKPGDVLMGNAKAGSEALDTARDFYHRGAKADKVEGLLDRAGIRAAKSGTGGNVDNTTRQEISKILLDNKQMRGFTPDELGMARAAVEGTPGQNVLRQVGKLSPTGSGLMLAIQSVMAGASGGASIPLAGAGYAAKLAADHMTKRRVDDLMQIILAGGSKSAALGTPNALERLSRDKRDALVRSLVAGSVPAGRELVAP
jgi:hypothetical protein